MKKNILITLLLSTFWFSGVFASAEKITREEAFVFFAETVGQDVPKSFNYIDLLYNWIHNPHLETALQKLVYLDLIKNSNVKISANKTLSTDEFIALSNKILWINITKKEWATTTISLHDLQEVRDVYQENFLQKKKQKSQITLSPWLSDKEKIFFDVKNTLEKSHYDAEDFSNNQLINAAISGLTKGTDDSYTTYFPPSDSKDFFTALDGEYEWIWAYVDMPNPGELVIVSPISWSPAEAAWLRWWDRVTHVGDKEVSESNNLREVISWIKGPANTHVELTILREGRSNPIIISVTRQKIIIKDIEYKKLDTYTAYVQIKNFWDNVWRDFTEALEQIKEDSKVQKIIFDLRNNPGGYLNEVANMLSYFVEEWQATAIVGYGKSQTPYISSGKNIINLGEYEIIFLQNSGTASASEIMIGTLKDYYPEATIIGEQSFWKGSVQSLKNYKDGSTLKYTTAKWYTGKTRRWIDTVGITPDIIVEFDKEKFDTYKVDTQLEAAIKH